MRTPPDAEGGGRQVGLVGRVGLFGVLVLFVPVLPALPAAPALSAPQAPQDPSALARAINDPSDDVQLKAIAETLNAFLAEPIVPKKRVGFVIEVRNEISAERIFSAGSEAIGTRPVPADVLTALRTATRDDNPRVGVEALYAFGVLAIQPVGAERHELLRISGPELAAFIGSPDPVVRTAAIRVLGRVFAWRRGDPPIDPSIGDAVVAALNDRDGAVAIAGMDALGAMRYDRALRALTQLFEYYGKGERAEAALDAIARIAHASSGPILAAALTSRSSAIRVIAIEGLARLREPSVLPALQSAAAADKSDRAALALAFANAMIAGGPIDPIRDALARPTLRDQARRYLAEMDQRNER